MRALAAIWRAADPRERAAFALLALLAWGASALAFALWRMLT